jgi:peptide/nickel transport system substrate-binding protein
VTGDRAQRQKILDALEQKFRTEVPAIILYNTRRVTALRAPITGYHSWAAQTQRLWNVGLGGVR